MSPLLVPQAAAWACPPLLAARPPAEACSSSQARSLCGAPNSTWTGFGLQVPCPWLMTHGDLGDFAGGSHADLRVRPHFHLRPLAPNCLSWQAVPSLRAGPGPLVNPLGPSLRGAHCPLIPRGTVGADSEATSALRHRTVRQSLMEHLLCARYPSTWEDGKKGSE